MRALAAQAGHTTGVGTAASWWRRIVLGSATSVVPTDRAAQPEVADIEPPRSVSPDVVIRASDTDAQVLASVSAETLDRGQALVAQIRERIHLVTHEGPAGDS